VSADLEDGYGGKPEDVAESFRQAIECGVVGASIEDTTGDPSRPICDIGLARERVLAAAEVAKRSNFKFIVTARADNFFYGKSNLADTIARLITYQEAGADVLYAPGLRNLDDIKTVLRSVDRPLNVLLGMKGVDITLEQLQAIGVRRVSVGASLVRVAYGAMLAAAREMKESGTFTCFAEAASGKVLNDVFKRPAE
jgi:2-methylisocitrate lyase-like PEP mutase family enzyme